MKGHPKVGASGEQKSVVEAKHAMDFADNLKSGFLVTLAVLPGMWSR